MLFCYFFSGKITEVECLTLTKMCYESFNSVCYVLGVDCSLVDKPSYSKFDRMLAVFKYKLDEDVTREELVRCLKKLQPPCHKAVLYLKYETKEENLSA